MIFKFKSERKDIFLEIKQNGKGHAFDFKKPFRDQKKGLKKEPFNFIVDGENKIKGSGVFGQDALWLPYGDGKGLKIIRTTKNCDEIIKNILYIKEIDCDIFPKINWVDEGVIAGVSCVFVEMQEVEEKHVEFKKPEYLSDEDFAFYKSRTNVPFDFIEKCIDVFIKHKLTPETSWFKSGGFGTKNIIGNKIVDFHMFSHNKESYSMPTENQNPEEVEDIYETALERYKKWISVDGVPKWKGKIYQGMFFDNGVTFPGYSSDGKNYDSYVKMNLLPLDKVKGTKVLDIGSNQGFLSFQSALAGASDVTGVELTKEDVLLADDIKEKILKLKNVNFINGDAIEFVEDTDDWYDLIIMTSVLHQTHPKLDSCDEFLSTVASKSRYFFFETPIDHKHYKYSLEQITNKLEEHFVTVKLVYFYDCYSTGYRAIYLCYPWDPSQNNPGVYEKMKKAGRVGKLS